MWTSEPAFRFGERPSQGGKFAVVQVVHLEANL